MPAYYLEISVVVLGLVMLLLDAFLPGEDRKVLAGVGIVGLLIVFVLNFMAKGGGEGVFWQYYTYGENDYAGFYKGIALASTIIVLVMAIDYRKVLRSYLEETHRGGEFYVLPVFTCAGLMWMASAIDLISIFVSLELVTISFYVLVAFMRRNVGSLEAGVKYLILGALSTGVMVYGITWIFGATGETNLRQIEEVLQAGEHNRLAVLLGFGLLLVGLGFKVGAVPFQMWIPDVYQGAAVPVTAFLSVASKAAGFIVLMRVTAPFLDETNVSDAAVWILAVIAGATLILGNLAAIPQSNFKRLLAYSSIAHAGFLLVALAVTPKAQALSPANVISFYLASYLMMTSLSFMVLTLVRVQCGGEEIRHFDGLARRSPFLALALLIGMVALAGLPLTAGFFGKFFVFQLAVQAEAWWLVALAAFGAATGFYYYLKVVKAMYFNAVPKNDEGEEAGPLRVPIGSRLVMAVLMVGIVAFGFNPSPLLHTDSGGDEQVAEMTEGETERAPR